MKDYSLDKAEKKTYILSYKINDGKIIAKLASGESYTIPYTEENEKSVISKMEKQALKAKDKSKDNVAYKIFPISIVLCGTYCIFTTGPAFICLSIITAISTAIYARKKIINIIQKRDIRKLECFLNYKDKINETIEHNENMLLNVRKKTINQIKKQQDIHKEPLNINNIDNYSLNDLITLKENLERIYSFGFNENENMIEKKGKQKKLKI